MPLQGVVPELRINGRPFGSADYFSEKRKNTVFMLCDSSRATNADVEKMLSTFKELMLTQFREIKEDFRKAKGEMNLIKESEKKQMCVFIEAMYYGMRKVGGTFNKSDLTGYLVTGNSARGRSGHLKQPTGRNGSKLCSQEYMNKIKNGVFGTSVSTSSYSNSTFSRAISDDVDRIVNSIFSDLHTTRNTIVRVNEDTKKSMIKILKILRGISCSNKAFEAIRIMDYEEELRLEIPLQHQVFGGPSLGLTPSLKPYSIKTKELLRGHQALHEYLRSAKTPQLHPKNELITAEYVEKYSTEISGYIKASLMLDSENETI